MVQFHFSFLFFPDTYVSLIIFDQSFHSEKNLKKDRFLHLIPQKNRLEKCRLEVKSVFKNTDILGEVID